MEYKIDAIFRHNFYDFWNKYGSEFYLLTADKNKIYRCTDHSLQTPLMSIPPHQQNLLSKIDFFLTSRKRNADHVLGL